MSDWGFSALASKFLLMILIHYLLLNLSGLAKTRALTLQCWWICCVYPGLIAISSQEVLPYQLHTGTSGQVFPIDPLKTLVVMKPLSGRTQEDTSPNQ